MKHLSLFVIAFILGITAKAQQVEIFNNTICDVEVVITGYLPGCGGLTGPSTILTIPATSSIVHVDIFASDFQVSAVVDPSNISGGGPIFFLSDIHPFPATCLSLPVTVGAVNPVSVCGATTTIGFSVFLTPFSPFPNGKITIDPI